MYRFKCNNQLDNFEKFALYLAIVKFLASIHPRKLQGMEDGLPETQCMLILPEYFSDDAESLETTFRPTLKRTSWISPNDCKSKVLFTSNWSCYLNYIQCPEGLIENNTKLQREKKHITCNIQKMVKQSKFLVTLNAIQMVYDSDFIIASQGSIATLSKNVLLSPKALHRIASIEVPFNCSLNKMKDFSKIHILEDFC